MSEDRSNGPRLSMPTDRHNSNRISVSHDFTINILITRRGVLLLGLIVPFTVRNDKSWFFSILVANRSVSGVLDQV